MEALRDVLSILLSLILSTVGVNVPGSDPEISAPDQFTTAMVVEVIDGDTIIVEIEGKEEFVRYIGIDTPEFNTDTGDRACYAAEAKEVNRKLVEGKQVRLEADTTDRDRYNRLLRYVYVGTTSINSVLLENGAAQVLTIPPNTRYAETFAALERAAKRHKAGLWNLCH